MSAALDLRDFGVQIGARAILVGVTFVVPDRGVVALMGPGGSGKSTLLRSLTEGVDHPSFLRSGIVLYEDEPLSARRRPVLVRQRLGTASQTAFEVLASALPNRGELTRLEQQTIIADRLHELGRGALTSHLDVQMCSLPSGVQRLVRIIAATFAEPAMVCIDEATAELDDEEAADVLDLIATLGLQRAVLFVTHNQRHARQVADYVGLLAAGRLVEIATTDKFFDNPDEDATRTYVRTGGCALPSPNATSGMVDSAYAADSIGTGLDEDTAANEQRTAIANRISAMLPTHVPSAAGPRGFRWLVPGRLGGTPYPGIVQSVTQDLDALRRVGITHLVTLTEEPATFQTEAADYGVEVLFFPIPDMHGPDLDAAARMCGHVAELLGDGATVAYHCKAGMGRTGVMLAAQLIHQGASATEALTTVRLAHAKWVQSKAQEQFLAEFARHVDPASRAHPSHSNQEGV